MTPKPMIRHHSPNHDARRAGPTDMLVLHYTGMRSGAEALERLMDPEAQVSAHYVVEEDGTILSLVPEHRRAWHAGRSWWRGETDCNSRSIGIEIVNPGHEFGYYAFPERQIDAVIRLCLSVLSRHPIPPRNVVGHSDIAPTRKQDPGELFPWARLKGYGIGLWPFDGNESADADRATIAPLLARFGYDITDLDAAIAAFQRHYRPERIDAIADAQTIGRLQRLLAIVD